MFFAMKHARSYQKFVGALVAGLTVVRRQRRRRYLHCLVIAATLRGALAAQFKVGS
ncbi:hypothetical protein [Piscinibacter sakaiensis]|uniref:hypothetical protein n=1 Tax=Piscinibacter sakaiensis TaxID=1547922 RepID=UPI003AAF9A3B